MDLGARIRRAREEAGLTQASLAFAMRAYPLMEKVGPSRISDWEGNKYPRIPFLAVVAIAQVTGKPIGFFSGELDEQRGAAQPGQPDPDAARAGTEEGIQVHEKPPRGSTARSRKRSRDSPT